MAKRAGKYLLILGIFGLLFLVWWFAPHKLLDGVNVSEIAYIEVQDGNTGKHFEIANSEYISYIVHNLKQAELYKKGLSLGHSGYGYKLKFYDGRERMLASFTLNSKSNVRKDPFFYVSSNVALCTDYIAKLEDEMIWVTQSAPVVSDKMTEEEKIERQKAVCEKGTILFEGTTDEGYFPSNISWLKKAALEDSIVLIYTCDDSSHGEWGVLGIGADIAVTHVQ